MKKALAISFFGFIYLAGVNSALACVCVPPADAKTELREAAAVFSGKLIGKEYRKAVEAGVSSQGESIAVQSPQSRVVVLKFQVERWWKGRQTKEVILYTDHLLAPDGTETISDCDFPFETGKRYLIYTFAEENRLKTNSCTRTKLLEKARGDLKALGKGLKPKRGR